MDERVDKRCSKVCDATAVASVDVSEPKLLLKRLQTYMIASQATQDIVWIANPM